MESLGTRALESVGTGVIDQSEILEVANETGLQPYVIEKDYVIGWALAGIYQHPELRDRWVFKGGTCLKKYADLEPFRDDVAASWGQMLEHQLPQLLPFESFWNELPDFFRWLELKLQIEVTAPVRGGAREVPVYAAQSLSSVATAPVTGMGRIRFAAANRLLIDLDYEALNGQRSQRLIEPYSLRLTDDGNVLLYATRHDSGEPRSYRVDRIRGATVTNRSFVPRYTIELTMTGPQATPPLSSQRAAKMNSGTSSMGNRVSGSQSTSLRLGTSKRSVRSRGIGPTYVYECTFCQRKFRRKKQNTVLKPHKDKSGWNCSGRIAWLVDTIW